MEVSKREHLNNKLITLKNSMLSVRKILINSIDKKFEDIKLLESCNIEEYCKLHCSIRSHTESIESALNDIKDIDNSINETLEKLGKLPK